MNSMNQQHMHLPATGVVNPYTNYSRSARGHDATLPHRWEPHSSPPCNYYTTKSRPMLLGVVTPRTSNTRPVPLLEYTLPSPAQYTLPSRGHQSRNPVDVDFPHTSNTSPVPLLEYRTPVDVDSPPPFILGQQFSSSESEDDGEDEEEEEVEVEVVMPPERPTKKRKRNLQPTPLVIQCSIKLDSASVAVIAKQVAELLKHYGSP